MQPLPINSVKCVIIGNGGVGKTSLCFTYTQGKFPIEYVPIVFDNWVGQVKIDKLMFNLNLWDTGGTEGYDVLRPLSYPGTHIFLVCFSVAEPASFKKVEEYWVPEIKRFCPDTPFILLGTKVDLRADRAILDKLAEKQEEVVSKEEGKRMAENLKAAKYLECSALTREGVKNVFEEAIRQHLISKRLKEEKELKESEKKKCNIF